MHACLIVVDATLPGWTCTTGRPWPAISPQYNPFKRCLHCCAVQCRGPSWRASTAHSAACSPSAAASSSPHQLPGGSTSGGLLLARTLLGGTGVLKTCFFAANALCCGLGSKGCSLGTTRASCCGRDPAPQVGKLGQSRSRALRAQRRALCGSWGGRRGRHLAPRCAQQASTAWPLQRSRLGGPYSRARKPWWHVVAGNRHCMTADLPVAVLPTCSADVKLAAPALCAGWQMVMATAAQSGGTRCVPLSAGSRSTCLAGRACASAACS